VELIKVDDVMGYCLHLMNEMRWILPTFLFAIKSYLGFHLNAGKAYNLACEQALSIEKQCSYRVKSRYKIGEEMSCLLKVVNQ